MTEERQLVIASEAAKWVHVSTATIRLWCHRYPSLLSVAGHDERSRYVYDLADVVFCSNMTRIGKATEADAMLAATPVESRDLMRATLRASFAPRLSA